MSNKKLPILVFGATGQQGGSVATALLKADWPVRALVRSRNSEKSNKLREAGVEIVEGDLNTVETIRAAMTGVHGVFSVQPSSGQGTMYNVTDDDEVRFGVSVADLAFETGVAHLVYTSASGVGDQPIGLGHFDTKGRIEAHIRRLSIKATIVRPAGFMDMLVMPGFGLDTGHFCSFARPDQSVQVLAVEDIGKFVAAIFADPERFGGHTLEIASDTVTGKEIGAAFTEAAGRPITYSLFPDEVLVGNPFLSKLAQLMGDGTLAGHADMAALRALNPEMQSFRSWLAGCGRTGFDQALGASGAWEYAVA